MGCTKRLSRRANPARKSEVRVVELMNVLVSHGHVFIVLEVDDSIYSCRYSTALPYLVSIGLMVAATYTTRRL